MNRHRHYSIAYLNKKRRVQGKTLRVGPGEDRTAGRRGERAGAVGKRMYYKHCTWRRKKTTTTRALLSFFFIVSSRDSIKMSGRSSSTWERGRDEALFFSPAPSFCGVARAQSSSLHETCRRKGGRPLAAMGVADAVGGRHAGHLARQRADQLAGSRRRRHGRRRSTQQ